jgi:hypothetical protein
MLPLNHSGFLSPSQPSIPSALQALCLIYRVQAYLFLQSIRMTCHIRKPFKVADTYLSKEAIFITKLSVGSNSGSRTEELWSMRGGGAVRPSSLNGLAHARLGSRLNRLPRR